MRINGGTVTFNPGELARFAARWPCFGAAVEPLSLTFARGDLIEVEGDESLSETAQEAVARAICEDAKAELARYGRQEMRAALDRQRRADADSAWLIDEAQAERGRQALEAAGVPGYAVEAEIWASLNALDRIGVEL
jgi:hypothetical protein